MQTMGNFETSTKIADKNEMKIMIDDVTYIVSTFFNEETTRDVVDTISRLIEKEAELA